MQIPPEAANVTRRDFLRKGALTGAGLMLAPSILRAHESRSADALNVAVIGCGVQGGILLDTMLKMPGLRIQAICDIWETAQEKAKEKLSKAGREGEARYYTDFEELLDREKDRGLDVAIIASPDFWHAPQTVACLKAGVHVYCEKMMSNTVEGARSMVRAMRDTGKLLQIGHQRRSNPRYQHAINQLIKSARVPGRITAVRAQWNHSSSAGGPHWPRGTEIPADTLKRYGYPSMRHFRAWRAYRDYSGGAVSDLGAHQMDIFNWVLGVRPTTLTALGGIDYFKDREHYDNVIAVYEYPTPEGMVRALYQVISSTSAGGGGFEMFMGDEGTIIISETPRLTKAYREARAPSWDQWVTQGYLSQRAVKPAMAGGGADERVDIRETMALDEFGIPVVLDRPIYQPHLENFFDAIRGKATLNFDGARALESEGIIFPINAAVAEQKAHRFTPADFEA